MSGFFQRSWMAQIILFLLLGLVAGCSNFSSGSSNQITINQKIQQVAEPSSIMQAATSGDQQRFREAVIAGESVNAVFNSTTALSMAIQAKQFEFAELLLRAGANPELGFEAGHDTTMMAAARVGATGVVRQLIRQGRNINYVDNQGYSALAIAAIGGHLTSVNVLINAGADVNVAPEGRSLLMHSVQDNNMIIIQPLIAAGADVNFVDEYGESALSIARRNEFHELDLMLVQAGARL